MQINQDPQFYPPTTSAALFLIIKIMKDELKWKCNLSTNKKKMLKLKNGPSMGMCQNVSKPLNHSILPYTPNLKTLMSLSQSLDTVQLWGSTTWTMLS